MLPTVLALLAGCADHRISTADVLAIASAEEWHRKTPDIIYVAMTSDLAVVNQLAWKVPMATKDDCTCSSGAPGDAAGVVIHRLYDLDPQMRIVQQMTAEDRSLFYRYCRTLQLVDWTDPEHPSQHGAAAE